MDRALADPCFSLGKSCYSAVGRRLSGQYTVELWTYVSCSSASSIFSIELCRAALGPDCYLETAVAP